MGLTKFKVELLGDNYEYLIYPIRNVDHTQEKSFMSIALPGQSARDNIMMGLEGMSADITITWSMNNDGVDKANGTYTSTVTTLQEQRNYLLYTIQASAFDAKWQLTDTTGSRYSSEDVVLNSLDLPQVNADSRKWKECRMDLTIGQGVG